MQRVLPFGPIVTQPDVALAHPGHGTSSTFRFTHGLVHPPLGLDHVLAGGLGLLVA